MTLTDKITTVLAIAGSSLVYACAEQGDDGNDSDPTAAATMDGSDTGGTDETTAGDETTGADESTTASETESGGSASEDSGDTGGTCDLTVDQCVVDSHCPDVGATCVDCMCVGGETTCTPGSCDTCPTQSECAYCSQPAEAECGPQNLACNMNAVCQTILQCQLDCDGDQTCEDQCVMDNPDGQADYDALIQCILRVCA